MQQYMIDPYRQDMCRSMGLGSIASPSHCEKTMPHQVANVRNAKSPLGIHKVSMNR